MFKCFTSARGIIVLAIAIVIGGYLVIWHGAHVAAALPFMVILACPLMHMFMHGGHGHHRGHGTENVSPPTSSTISPQTSNKGE